MESRGSPSPRSTTRREIRFPPYRLDLEAGFLRAGDRAVSLRPKTWGVLCYLAERPGILVTKEELLDAVWSGIAVTESTLTKSIGEIRDALQDDVRHPRFVETVHRRGFRFVSAVEGGAASPRPEGNARAGWPAPAHVVGREAELERLHALLETAAGGKRQVAFITGEGGIGKTTLTESFLASIAGRSAGDVCVATGQCVRRHSGEEPLMPVLEALGRLARSSHGARVVQLLQDRAPGWLVQLPWLVAAGSLQDIRAGLSGTTPERMLRVFAQLLEELTADVTLVLVLEDLHWADASTVDLLAVLAERPEQARLLVLGTYRPAEAIAHAGPFDGLRRVLGLRGRAVDIPLRMLPESGVQAYLSDRFGTPSVPAPLARLLYAHTEGNPLFLVTAVNFLVARGWLEQSDGGVVVRAELETLERHIPASLQELVELQVLDLDPFEVAVLEAASVAGVEFGAQAVAAALDVTPERVEEACERLMRSHRFLAASDTEAWPDGAVAARYVFAHALYQRVFYHRLPAGRRRLLHRRIGERLEAGFGNRAADVAAELAAHFERGSEPARAIPWLVTAATSAEERFAPREAAVFLRRALALLERTPDDPARRRSEMTLATSLGAAVIANEGFGAEEAWPRLMRARDLARDVGTTTDRFRVAYMLVTASQTRADVMYAPVLAEELAAVAEELDVPEARLAAATLAASMTLWSGHPTDAGALATCAAGDPVAIGAFVPGVNLVVWAKGFEGWRLWLLGRPEQALVAVRDAVACARALSNPLDLPMALFLAAQVLLWRGDLDDTATLVEEGTRLATEHGYALWLGGIRGVAGGLHLARGEAVAAEAVLRQAIEQLGRLGVRLQIPTLLVGLAAASLRRGRLAEGFAAVEQGIELARTTFNRSQAAELGRVRSELLAARGDPTDAVESSFQHALEIARSQAAVAFELRAATAYARWLASCGRTVDARAVLAPRHEAFREGLDTADVRAASTLLEEQSS